MTHPPPPFAAELTRHPGVARLALRGELDLAARPRFEAAIPQPAEGDVLVIDLRALEFIDSSGVHVLMRLDVAARQEGWSLVIVRARREVQRMLDLCHVGDRIRTVDAPADVSPALA
jgi:anti-sigma B factor antagonist